MTTYYQFDCSEVIRVSQLQPELFACWIFLIPRTYLLLNVYKVNDELDWMLQSLVTHELQ